MTLRGWLTELAGVRSKGGRRGRPGFIAGLTLVTAMWVALAGCRSVSGQPLPGPSAETFTGTAARTCGPTDAAGLQLDLSPADARAAVSVSISLWGAGMPTGHFVKSFTNPGGGSGRWCSLAGDCVQASSGTVWFDGGSTGGHVTGAFRLDAAPGAHLEGTFEAQIDSGAPIMCG